jgi:epoxyqueuosine reductase QueG
VLSAWIRELGFRASMAPALDAVRLAVAAKLGTLDRSGKLVTADYGTRVHVADVIRTDLPLITA